MTISQLPYKGFLPINGTHMYVEMKGQGKPLLFLHAGVADSRMWQHQFDAFSQTHCVIRCDLRGFGQTTMRPGSFAHYEDIASILNALHINSVSLIGASFGGAVALDFALAYPEMVTEIILAAPALGGYTFTSAIVLDFFRAEAAALEQNNIDAATELNMQVWVDGFDRPTEAVSSAMRNFVADMQRNIFSQPEVEGVVEIELMPAAIDRLDTIGIPTLVMVGDKDLPEFQSIAQHIAQSIPSARYSVINDTAHLPSMEKPMVFKQLVTDFLL